MTPLVIKRVLYHYIMRSGCTAGIRIHLICSFFFGYMSRLSLCGLVFVTTPLSSCKAGYAIIVMLPDGIRIVVIDGLAALESSPRGDAVDELWSRIERG